LAVAAVTMGVAAAVVVFAAARGNQGDVLSQEDVARALADNGATDDATASPGPKPTSPLGGQFGTSDDKQILTSQGGRLVVACDGDTAALRMWIPNSGYRADDAVRGPAARVSVWFESDKFEDVEAVATCRNGTAVLTDNVEADDHGGDSGPGGGGSGGGSGHG
jgi:hypothetical protein